jgi:hypothetical protein
MGKKNEVSDIRVSQNQKTVRIYVLFTLNHLNISDLIIFKYVLICYTSIYQVAIMRPAKKICVHAYHFKSLIYLCGVIHRTGWET